MRRAVSGDEKRQSKEEDEPEVRGSVRPAKIMNEENDRT